MVTATEPTAQLLFNSQKKLPINIPWRKVKDTVYRHSSGSFIYYQNSFFQVFFTFTSTPTSPPLLVDVTHQIDQSLKDAIANSTRLLNAIENNKITMFSQPLSSLKGQHCISELLTRLCDWSLWPQALPASALSSHYAATRLAHWTVGWALNTPTTQRWSVNVPLNCIDQGLLALMQGELACGPLEPEQMVIEVACPSATSSPYHDNLKQLKRLGVQIALQDFGSAPWLDEHNLALCDYIKVSGALISQLHKHPSKQERLQQIVQLAHAQDVEVVAQWVQDGFELQTVRDAGCDYAQGFYLGQPRHEQTKNKTGTKI